MQYPDVWYGPFAEGDSLSFGSAGGFVWAASAPSAQGGMGVVLPYPDPYLQFRAMSGCPLQQSRFSARNAPTTGSVFGLQGG
ncbi:MAG: hypothetical protein U1F68_19280 [Gammaproteobacteria bacterium]